MAGDVEEVGEEVGSVPNESLFDLGLTTEPVWLSKFNCLSLLNLPEMLKEFGSPRNYFEGKYMGERYVQEVKTIQRQCPPTNVCGTLLRKLHEGKALEFMAAGMQSENLKTFRLTESGNNMKNQKRKQLVGNCRIYKTRVDVITEFHSNKPFCVLETENKLGALFYQGGSNQGNVMFMQVTRLEDGCLVYQGMRYSK